jgi:cytosine/adenosine deaminase-related metal-dependent hydrolase
MILRARTVLPVSQPPIANGAVAISGNRIAAVGSWKNFTHHASRITHHDVLDLGEVILLPGLVNAHCHLDYTGMAGEFLPPKSFTDWIKLITAAKGGWTYSDFAQSWLDGAQMLLRSGTTTVADFESVPELLPEAWSATPLRVFSFLEMTGVKSRREPRSILDAVVEKIASLEKNSHNAAGLAPHAPYSTMPELLRLTAETARRQGWLLATHAAESVEEFEMFQNSRGVMFDWLKRNQRDNSDCGLGSPVAHLARNDMLGENLTVIHANLLAHGDAELLGRNCVHVVHCPRSHDYFSHPPFPRRQLADAGVNLCLGTDSLATVRKTKHQKLELNLFDEMRRLAAADKTVSPVEILRMATVNGAKALGMAGQIGELLENACADLIAIPFAGKNADIYDAVLHHASTVSASMIDGKWAIAP